MVCDNLAGGVAHDAAPDGRADAELEPGHEDGGAADTARYKHRTWSGSGYIIFLFLLFLQTCHRKHFHAHVRIFASVSPTRALLHRGCGGHR